MSYTNLQKNYSNQFVARLKGRIVASGKTMQQLFAHLSQKKVPYDRQIWIAHIPPKKAVCIYVHRISSQ